MKSFVRRFAAPLALAATLGCGSTSPNGGLIAVSFADVESATPQFGWFAGAGLMNFVQLTTESDQNTILWRVETPGVDGVDQPVVYGQTPPGATQSGAVPALVSGTEYRVTVRRGDGLGGSGRFRKP